MGQARGGAIVSPGLTYAGLTTNGNAATMAGEGGGRQDLASDMFTDFGTTYISLLMYKDAANPFPMLTINSNPAGAEYLWMGLGGSFQMEVGGAGGAPFNSWGGGAIADGFTMMVGIQFINQAGNDEVRVLLNPDLSSAPTWSTPDFLINSVDLTVADAGSWLLMDGTGIIDEIRVGTTWADVVPEPATMCLLGLGALALIRKRK